MPTINDLVNDVKKHAPSDKKEKSAEAQEEDFEALDKHQGEVKIGLYRVLKLAESLTAVTPSSAASA